MFPGLSLAIPEETFLLFEIYDGQLPHLRHPGELSVRTFKFEPRILGGGASGMNTVLCTNQSRPLASSYNHP